MKHLLFLIEALLISSILNAQPTITSSWIPSPGDNFIQRGATSSQLPFYLYSDSGLGLTGNNVTWDFSQLQLQNNYDTIRYTGTTDSLVQTDMNQSIVLKLSDNQLLASGLPNLFCGDVATPFSQIFNAVYYQFPMVDTPVSGDLYLDGNSASCGDYYNVQYKGWGNLILPNGNNVDNVLMIKRVIGSQSVVYYVDEDDDNTGIPMSVTISETDSYQWVIANVSTPILNIHVVLNTQINFDWTGITDSIQTKTIDTTVAVWLYQSRFNTGLSETANPLGTLFQIYPNPTNSSFIVQTIGAGEQLLLLFDLTGQLIITQPVENSKTIVDTRLIPPGMYIAKLETTDGMAEQKVIIER